MPIRIVYTDQRPEDELHAPLQRVAAASAHARISWSKGSYIGKIGKKLVGPQLFQRRAVHQFADHRPAAVAAERRAARAVQPRRHQRAVARARQLLPKRLSQPAAAGRPPHGSHLLVLGSYALSKNLTNQPENTTGLISNIPNPFDLDSLWGPSIPRSAARRRRVVGLESAARASRMPISSALAERLDDDRLPSHPVGQPAGVHDGRRRRAERHAASRTASTRCWCPARRPTTCGGIIRAPTDMVAMYFNTAAFVPLEQHAARRSTATPRRGLDLRTRRRDHGPRDPALPEPGAGLAPAAARRVLQRVQPGELQQSEDEHLIDAPSGASPAPAPAASCSWRRS